jgi:hypothetical protein
VGEKYGHKAGSFMLAIEGFPSKIVNAGQLMVGDTLWVNIGYYPVDGCYPQTSSKVHLNTDAGISESPDSCFREVTMSLSGYFEF